MFALEKLRESKTKRERQNMKACFPRKPTSCTSDGINARDVFIKEKAYGIAFRPFLLSFKLGALQISPFVGAEVPSELEVS